MAANLDLILSLAQEREGNRANGIEVSDDLKDWLRANLDKILIGKGQHSQNSLHIPDWEYPEDVDIPTRCQTKNRDDIQLQDKPITAYPRDWCDWCNNCIEELALVVSNLVEERDDVWACAICQEVLITEDHPGACPECKSNHIDRAQDVFTNLPETDGGSETAGPSVETWGKPEKAMAWHVFKEGQSLCGRNWPTPDGAETLVEEDPDWSLTDCKTCARRSEHVEVDEDA